MVRPARPRTWVATAVPAALPARAGVALAALVLALTANHVLQADPALSFERRATPIILLLGLAGAVLLVDASWELAPLRPIAASAAGLAVIGLVLPVWAGATNLPLEVRAASTAVSPLVAAGVAGVALRWSTATGRRAWAVVLAIAAAAVVLHLLAYDPGLDVGCARLCRRIAVPWSGATTSGLVDALRLLTTLVALAAILSLWWRSPATRPPRGITLASLASLAILAIEGLLGIVHRVASLPADHVLVPSVCVAVLMGVTVAAAARRMVRTRRAVAELLETLADTGGARGGSSDILGIEAALPDGGGWAPLPGRPVTEPMPGARWVAIGPADEPVMRLVLRPGADEAAVLSSITPGHRIALQAALLRVVTEARIGTLRDSRARIVATGDAERRRIEHDLHDRAQQQLITASVHLQVARHDHPAAGAWFEAVATDIQASLSRLRRVSHGIYPAALASEGLAAALEELSEATPVRVTASVRAERVPETVGLATLATVSAVLEHVHDEPGQGAIRIDVDQLADTVRVSVERDGRRVIDAARLIDVEDRVGAIGGRVVLAPGGAHLEAVMPCA